MTHRNPKVVSEVLAPPNIANDRPALYAYELELHLLDGGTGFGRRPVLSAALEIAKCHHLFEAQRLGLLPFSADSDLVYDEPLFNGSDSEQVCGIRLTVPTENGDFSREYPLALFDHSVVQRAGQLVAAKQVTAQQPLGFSLYARPYPVEQSLASEDRVVCKALPIRPASLAPLLSIASRRGPTSPSQFPVFCLPRVLADAREYSWRGRTEEAGAWLIGSPFFQTLPTPETFLILHTAIEARGAAHDRFSLTLSNESHHDLRAQMARRAKLGMQGELIAGFWHSHPFLPSILDGKEACPQCALRPTCTLSSTFFSSMDVTFHHAFFGRAPYAVQFVLGLSPREEFDLRMFAWNDGLFTERGYFELPELPGSFPYQL